MSSPAASPDIARERLMARLSAARPRLTAVIAPAGYGKSTVVRQYAATLTSSTVCDCRPVGNLGDLARAVAFALAHGDEALTAAVSRQRLAGIDEQAWTDLAISLWSNAHVHDLFIFENTEHIVDRLEYIEFFERLLARTPRPARTAICSRRALPLSLSRYVAPHELLTLRSDDLRFDKGEIATAFADFPVTQDGIARVVELTHGWPMAVLLLARIARENPLPALFERLGGIAFEDLYDYLAEQVLAAMPPDRFMWLVAVAAIPRATAGDVCAALNDPDALAGLPAFAKTSPFLYAISQTEYEAHPLLAAMLRERHAQICAQTLRSAADVLRLAEPLRSAQLYMELGDEEAAASQLENASQLFMSDPPALFAEISSRLSSGVLLRHGGVWSAATAVRATAIPHRQWLHEALIARDNLAADAPIAIRAGVLTSLGNVLTNLGRHEEALAVFRSFDADDVPQPYRLVSRLSQACVEARRGRLELAAQMWKSIEAAFAEIKFTRAIALEEINARWARYNGDRDAERMFLETAVALARESGAALAMALTLEEAAFAAWFAGEDSLFHRYADELDAAVAPNTARGTEVFRGTASGDYAALHRNDGVEHPKIHCYASLIACGSASNVERREFAQRALRAATDAGEPMSEAIAAVACAECGVGNRTENIRRAALAAARVDAQPLRDAIEAYASGADDCGLLDPLLRRLRAEIPTERNEPCARLRISILECSAERSGTALKLSNRELELVLYLATQSRACASGEILEALWPDRDERDDTVLRVCVARVRGKLGTAAITATDKGYRLDPAIVFDLDDIERTLRQARRENVLPARLRQDLEEHFARLCRPMPHRIQRWEWFTGPQLRIDELRRETALLLGRDALASGNIEHAKLVAKPLIENDPCDEPARELFIRACLAGGDRAAAMRELRVYRKMLAQELGAEPSDAIEALILDMNESA